MIVQNQKLPKNIIKFLLKAQRNEITEELIYNKLANFAKNQKNQKILRSIAKEENKHYNIWKSYTNVCVKPNKLRASFFVLLSRIFWLWFGIKLMERWEVYAQKAYEKFFDYIPEAVSVQQDEEKHEKELISMIDDKALSYIWSIVLWLNDALVELTWVLAGLTLWLQDPKLIAVVGLITWISASLSMWASEYLSTKAEWGENALTSSVYTWAAYIITVALLILPFLLINNPFLAMPITMIIAVVIIAAFNWYVSVIKEYNFRHRFWEMVWISMWVAVISFGIWLLVRHMFGL